MSAYHPMTPLGEKLVHKAIPLSNFCYEGSECGKFSIFYDKTIRRSVTINWQLMIFFLFVDCKRQKFKTICCFASVGANEVEGLYHGNHSNKLRNKKKAAGEIMKITMEKLFILFRHYVSLYIVFVVSPMLTILIM